MPELLRCNDLSKKHGRVQVLGPINLTLQEGCIIGLVGPNGSGKTTLMKMIAGLLTPTTGDIFLSNIPIGLETKKEISFLPDKTYLNDWMTVRQIIHFFSDFYTDFDDKKALDMLMHLKINPADTLKTMSKGTKEKVQLILVMSRNASLYLLDEPIGGVDPAAREYILNTIITNYNKRASVIIATHLISDIEPVLDHIILLNKGKILKVSSTDEIRQEHGMSVDRFFREEFKC